MNKIKLSEGLLGLIIMIQDYKKHITSVNMFNRYHSNEVKLLLIKYQQQSQYLLTQLFYNSIDIEILRLYELSKNQISFEKVYDYKITEDMLSTEAHLLSKFEF